MPFSSKGFSVQSKQKSDELEQELINISSNGNIPILCDTSPCTRSMLQNFSAKLNVYEPIRFTLEILTQYLDFIQSPKAIAIHSTCSSRTMGLHQDFIKLANLCSSDVTVPNNITCCGFAGDKGFNFPELNKSALRTLKSSLKPEIKNAFSTSKTCEIGLCEHSGIDYNSIFYLVDECTIAKV